MNNADLKNQDEVKSLVSIVNDIQKLEVLLIESSGEITKEIEDLLEVKTENLPDKIDNYDAFMNRLEMVSEYYEKRAKLFLQASKSAENAKKRLKDNIIFAMKALNVTDLHGFDVRFKLQKTSGSVEILDEALIEPEFKKEKIEIVIDKKKLKTALEENKEIPGARLIEGTSLRTYMNKR